MSSGVVLTDIDDTIDYPTGDGKPMAETPVHRQNLTDAIEILEDWLADERDVYVSGNMFLYFERGDKRRHVSPDVFVVLGVPREARRAYFTWLEPKPTLDFVIELTSQSTKKDDLGKKLNLYRDVLGVREYLLFDPFQEYLKPPQQLFRLTDGRYVPVEPINRRVRSEVLGLEIGRDDDFLAFWDPRTKTRLHTARNRERLGLTKPSTVSERLLELLEQEQKRGSELERRLTALEADFQKLRSERN